MAATKLTTPTTQDGIGAWHAFEVLRARDLVLLRRNATWAALDADRHLVASNPDPIQALLAAETALDASEETKLSNMVKTIRAYVERGTVVLVPRKVNAGTPEETTAWDVRRPAPDQATILGSDFSSWLEAAKATMEAGW